MSQFGRPSADTNNAGSYVNQAASGTTIYQSIDEDTIDDDDYIRSPNSPVAAAYTTKLTTLIDPGIDTAHILRYRAKKDLLNPADVVMEVQLRQGYVSEVSLGTLIATRTETLTTGLITYEYELTTLEAALITNYNSLYVRFITNP